MELLILSVVGGLLALDATSVGQFMLSRPLVAGVLAGWAAGDAATGLLVGSILELYLLVSFPSGGARFPEGATGTVVAVAAAASVEGPGALALAVAFGLVWGQVGGFSITSLRHLNARMAPEPGRPVTPSPGRVTGFHLGAVALDLLRGTAVTAAGIAVGLPLVRTLAPAWPLALPGSGGLLLGLLGGRLL